MDTLFDTRYVSMFLFMSDGRIIIICVNLLSHLFDPGSEHRDFRNKSKWAPRGPPSLEAYITSNELGLQYYKHFPRGKDNLLPKERQALCQLKTISQSVIIKQADKGSAVVLQDRRDYINEGFRQLNDPNYYEPQPTDLTPIHMDAISAIANRMTTDGELSKHCQSYLLGFKPRTARFYMLPKLHKNKLPPPGRPIISGNNSPTERISQLVDHFLKPASPLGPSYIKDTTHFLQIMSEVGPLPPGCLLVTLDVSSLYTNIPNTEGIQAALEALETIRPGAQHPTNSSLIKLLELVLKSNNFTFCGRHFLQIGGTAMGTRAAPNYAITHMHRFEKLHVYTYHLLALLWKRFIDDIFLIWPHPPPDPIAKPQIVLIAPSWTPLAPSKASLTKRNTGHVPTSPACQTT